MHIASELAQFKWVDSAKENCQFFKSTDILTKISHHGSDRCCLISSTMSCSEDALIIDKERQQIRLCSVWKSWSVKNPTKCKNKYYILPFFLHMILHGAFLQHLTRYLWTATKFHYKVQVPSIAGLSGCPFHFNGSVHEKMQIWWYVVIEQWITMRAFVHYVPIVYHKKYVHDYKEPTW